jgi:hypothetical protein
MSVRHHRARRAALAAIIAAGLTAGTVAVTPTAAHAATLDVTSTASSTIFGSASPTYDGVYRQSLAILALDAAGESVPETAEQWLLDQQCANGGFPSFRKDVSAPCAPFDSITYSGGIDSNATAVAAQALLVTGHDDEAQDAIDLLVDAQESDGGWAYTLDDPFGSSDPNSAGLVLMALNAAGVEPDVDPVPFFADLQVGRNLVAELESDLGGIASPWSGGAPDVLATVQSIPALNGFSLVDVLATDDWDADPTAYPTTPSADAADVAGWATTWLAGQVDADEVSSGNLAWAVLSFASNGTAKDAADAAYADIVAAASAIATNPAALAQATLAGVALDEDVDAFTDSLVATLSKAVVATYSFSAGSLPVDEALTISRSGLGADPAKVETSVSWGEGSTSSPSGAWAAHVYSAPGTYEVTFEVVSSELAERAFLTTSITVTAPVPPEPEAPKPTDTGKPVIVVDAPSSTKVKAWRTLRGSAADNKSEVTEVRATLVQKRGKGWFAYDGTSWTKKASKAKAKNAADAVVVKPTADGDWTVAIAKLTKGRLVGSLRAVDAAGNVSKVARIDVVLGKKK